MTIDLRRAIRIAPAIALAACAAAGCAHHSIKPGPWRLTIESKENGSRPFVKKPRDVDVKVEWSAVNKGAEDVRVSYESREDSQPVERVLAGQIENGRITLDGEDHDWILHLPGKIHGPESASGPAWGRLKWNDKVYFSGSWTMVKASE